MNEEEGVDHGSKLVFRRNSLVWEYRGGGLDIVG